MKFILHARHATDVNSNVLKVRAKVVVSLVAVAMAWAQPPASLADEASKLYKEGRKAERAGEMARAYLLYSKAAALAPRKRAYWLRSQAVRTRAASQSKFELPNLESRDREGADAVEDSAANDEAVVSLEPITEKDLREARKLLPPPELKASGERKDFNLKADPRRLFEQVAQAFGLDVVFDGDYPDGGNPLTFRMEQADYREALHALEAMTSTFVFPITEHLFMAAKDTQQKRNDVEPDVTVVIPIPQTVTVQDAQELARSVQQVMEIKRFGIDTQRRLVLLNGPVAKVRPAQMLFEDLLTYKPQVNVELEFIEVTHSEALNLGLTLPTSFPIVPLTTVLHNAPSLSSSLSYVLFGGGASAFAIGVANATVIANFNKSNARTLLRTIIRSVDGMPATFHVGEKYPVLTGGYFGPSSFSGAGAYRPPPSFTFEDLGLLVKLTPRIHGTDEVSIELDAEFKVLAGQALNGIPIISSRKLSSKVRLKEDEFAVVAGLMSTSEARSISGLAGLAQIPGLGWLVRQNNKSKDSDEVIIVMRPHLLSLPPDETVTRSVWVGTESRPMRPL
jgi:general secretion pathway protein D